MSVASSHNAGFFSCCSIRLWRITQYINIHKKLPKIVDTSKSYNKYKPEKSDVTFNFFEHYDKIKNNIIIDSKINYHHHHQFSDYTKLNYLNKLKPIIEKYFTPSKKVNTTVEQLVKKYNIDYENTIAVYYRGTDKYKETKIAPFESFYNKIKEITEINPELKILIQTDTTQFIDYIKEKKMDSIIIEENTTSSSKKGIHNEKSSEQNYNDMFNLLSTFIIISKCKYFVCSSGNCSIWMVLYRGNANNVYQYCNNRWFL